MHTGGGDAGAIDRAITRRDALQGGLTAGLGCGTLTLVETVMPPRTAAAAPVYGGHAVVLNAAYPETWDPHLAGTLGALAAISSMYNQVVEFNPLNPSEVIGDLATHWEVQDGG